MNYNQNLMYKDVCLHLANNILKLYQKPFNGFITRTKIILEQNNFPIIIKINMKNTPERDINDRFSQNNE